MAIAITSIFPTLEPEDSLIMGNEELSTIPEKESDEFIKSSVEDLVPILSESEDTFESDSDCDLPSCDDFSPIHVYEEKIVNFSSTLLFDLNDDLTSSDTSHYTMRTFLRKYRLSMIRRRYTLSEILLSRLITIHSLPQSQDCPDYEDSRAHGFVHCSLELQSFACLYMGI
ncbi:hypothetical protein Tco_1494073 [Tanacetum coccineum]